MSETTAYAGNLSVFSVGGNSQLDYLQNANIRFTETQVEGAAASKFGGNSQGVKMQGEITFSVFSDQATDNRVSHLDVSAADLGSVDLLSPNILNDLQFSVDYTHGMNPSIGDLWAFPVIVDRRFAASLRCAMMTDDAPDLLVDFMSGTYADKNKTLGFTINSVGVECPMRVTDASMAIAQQQMLEYNLSLADRSGRSGVTILPSGTTSLLEKALNQSRTALAFSFRPKAHPSMNFSGNMIVRRVSLGISDNVLIPISYTYATQGTVTGAPTVS